MIDPGWINLLNNRVAASAQYVRAARSTDTRHMRDARRELYSLGIIVASDRPVYAMAMDIFTFAASTGDPETALLEFAEFGAALGHG